jgi:ATP-dependent DNA helicase RecQ
LNRVNVVIIYGLPCSIEQYWQYAGRLGRGPGITGQCILYYSQSDQRTIRYFLDQMPAGVAKARNERQLNDMIELVNSGSCLRSRLVGHFEGQVSSSFTNSLGCCANCLFPQSSANYGPAVVKLLVTLEELMSRHGKNATLRFAAGLLAGTKNKRHLKGIGKTQEESLQKAKELTYFGDTGEIKVGATAYFCAVGELLSPSRPAC